MSAWPELSPTNWQLSHLCDQLLAVIERKVFEAPVPAETDFQTAMSFILAKARDNARAAIRLAKAGYGSQAAAVCRAIVEASIDSRFIEKAPDKRAEAFLRTSRTQTQRLAQKLHKFPHPDEARELVEASLRLERETGWPRNIADRAYDLENPSHSYDVVFFMLSDFVHPNITALAGKVTAASPNQLRVRIGRGDDWVEFALVTVFLFFHEIARIAFGAYRMDTASLDELRERLMQLEPLGLNK